MSAEGYVEHVRSARRRTSVIKIKVMAIRSGDRDTPIFVFEGKTDLGPYEAWIRRIESDLIYKALPADGKGQVLNYRDFLRDVSHEDMGPIFFFVDCDFDGLRGHEPSDDTYCLDSYSYENYLVTDKVLDSILSDEFECTAEAASVQSAHNLYSQMSERFCEAMDGANARLYNAAIYCIDRGRIENRINQFVEISMDSVIKKYDDKTIKKLIPLERECSSEEVAATRADFLNLGDRMKYHRGKYIFSFFLSWLDQLAEARKSGSFPFDERASIKYSRASMSPRSLASRSQIPSGLFDFISRIRKECAI